MIGGCIPSTNDEIIYTICKLHENKVGSPFTMRHRPWRVSSRGSAWEERVRRSELGRWGGGQEFVLQRSVKVELQGVDQVHIICRATRADASWSVSAWYATLYKILDGPCAHCCAVLCTCHLIFSCMYDIWSGCNCT
jgi:hypothetical protein